MASVPYSEGSITRGTYITDGSSPRYYWKRDDRKKGYRQKPKPKNPINPLPYSAVHWRMLSVRGSKRANAAVYPNAFDSRVDEVCSLMLSGDILSSKVFGDAFAAAQNRAYAKLIDKIHGTKADFGTTLAESREALDLIVQRTVWLGKAYSQLRKGNFRGFINTLGMKAKPKHRRTRWTRSKDASGLWLEYWMGWAPLCSDIYNATQVVLEGPHGSLPFPVRAGSSSGVNFSEKFRFEGENYRWTGRVHVHNGCTVEVTNENLATLGKLGLLNPATIAWNVIPFSFMVDWFGNIGQVLSSYTDLMGYRITRAWTSRLARLAYEGFGTHPKDPRLTFQARGQYVGMNRVNSIQRPVLHFQRPNGLSVTRAATSISLLVSIFTKG